MHTAVSTLHAVKPALAACNVLTVAAMVKSAHIQHIVMHVCTLKQQHILMIIWVSSTLHNSCHLGNSADHRSVLPARHIIHLPCEWMSSLLIVTLLCTCNTG